MKRSVVIIVLLLAGLAAGAQGKMYTRKARLEDFQGKTLKVVLCGEKTIDAALTDEVASRWVLSPYEYNTKEDYERDKDDSGYYFLRLKPEKGVLFLTLEKGGTEDGEDMLKRSFEVVSIPAFSEENPNLDDVIYLSAYIDIIQDFTSKAIASDSKAYTGLHSYNLSNLNGKDACTDSREAREWFRKNEPDTVVGIVVAPTEPREGDVCYKMLISTDTHRLYYYRTHKISSRNPAGFLPGDFLRIYGSPKEP